MSKRKVTNYPEECKKSSAQLAVDSKQAISQTAKELGLNISTLHGWVQKYYPDNKIPTSDTPESLHAELKRLKKALSAKEEECEILKKTSAYFAKQMR